MVRKRALTSNNNMAKLENQGGIDTAFDFYFKR